MIKVFLDNVNISNNVEIDLSFVEKLDTELDEGFIIITHTNREDPFPLYSKIDIFEDENLIFTGRIAQDNVDIVSFSSRHYNHKITIIEHTKILEKYLVTGKSFTQPIEDVGVAPYTLYDVLEILRTTTRFQLTGNEEFNTPFIIPNELKEELETIIAPEFNFKDVNLREAINEIFSYLDGIARLDKNDNIQIDKFNVLKNEVNIISENYKRSQDITNYATMISSEINNPVNSEYGFNVNNTEYYPGKHLWTTLRSERLGQFDFDTSFIPTPKPIYDIKKVLTSIRLVVTKEDLNTTIIEEVVNDPDFPLDITENIVERSIFNALEDKNPSTLEELTKRNVIIYDYGKKGISVGLTYGLFDIKTTFDNLLNSSLVRQLKADGIVEEEAFPTFGQAGQFSFLFQGPNGEEFSYLVNFVYNGNITDDLAAGFRISTLRWRALFRVEYVPIPPSIRYEVVRDDVSEVFVESKAIINQKLRIVDLERFTANMKGKINQLGTSELILSHKVKNISQTFDIGDFTVDRFVITKKEVIAQRDHYIVNYELNKNFNKVSQFVGIDQEVRQYEIGESGRTIDRDLNYNEYIEVFADDSATLTPGVTTLQTPQLILDTFDSSFDADKDLKYGLFVSPQVLQDGGQTPLKINVPIYKLSGGGAFGLYTDFESNVGASDQLTPGDAGFLGVGGSRRFNFPVRYGDELGRFDTMFMSFYNDVLPSESDIQDEYLFASEIPVFRKQEGTPVIEGNFFVKKDNRERLKFTLLYHFVSRNINEVIVGEKLFTHNSLFIDKPNTVILKKFNILGSNKKFSKRDFNLPIVGEDEKIVSPNITIDKNNMFIQIEDDLSLVSSWALVDENDIPYLIVNGNKKRVLFDFKSERDEISQPGEPEPLRLLRPELESAFGVTNSTTLVSTLTFVIGNPNDEVVTIRGVLGNQVVEQIALQNSAENNIVFANLQPNLNYSPTFTILPVEGSTSLESLPRTFSRTTPLPTIVTPTYEFVSYQIIGQEEISPGVNVNIYSVTFSITNPNTYSMIVSPIHNGSNVSGLVENPTVSIPPSETREYTISKLIPFNQTVTVPSTQQVFQNVLSGNMFALRTYSFNIRLRSSTSFTNPWNTPLGPTIPVFIDLERTTTPEVTWVPSNLTGRMVFNVKNKDDTTVRFAFSTSLRLNGVVISAPELTNLVENEPFVEIAPEGTYQVVIQNLVGGVHGESGEQNPFNVYQLEAKVVGVDKNVSLSGFGSGRLAGKAKPPQIINVNSTSTNVESFINFQLVNRERYTAQVFYAANTFDSNFTPNIESVTLAPNETSSVISYAVPANNQNDLHYVHALTKDPQSVDFLEVREDSDIIISPPVQPADLIQQLTVRFFDFDGNVIRTVLKNPGDPLLSSELPTTPTKAGYSSTAWVNQNNQQYFVNFPVNENLDWERNWTLINYTITYVLNGGTNSPNNPSTYTVLDNITFEPATRLGYDFEGWFLEPGFGTQITSITAGSTGNITLYARLDLITLDDVIFTFDTTINSITVTATNPPRNPRFSTDGAITNIRFGLKRASNGQVISSILTRQFAGLEEDEIVVQFTGLDIGNDYVLFGDSVINGDTDGIRTFANTGDFVDSIQPAIPVSTVTPVGNKSLRVRIASFGPTQSTNVTWFRNGVSQGQVSVNNAGFTTLSSTLFDDENITLAVPLTFAGSNLEDFIVNGVPQNVITDNITLQVNNGLDIDVVYN